MPLDPATWIALGSAALGAISGSKSKTQRTSNAPWAAQQPYLKEVFKEGQKLYQQGPVKYFPGQTVADFTPEELAAQQMLLGYVPQAEQQSSAATRGLEALQGALDVRSNPYLRQYVQAATQPVMDQLRQSVLPGIRGRAVMAGGYGGSRQGIAEGLAAQGALDAVGNLSARMYSDAYARGLRAMQGALQLAPAVQKMGAFPATLQSTIGETRREMNQAKIDAEKARWDFQQNAAWDALRRYREAVQGDYGGVQSSKSGGGVAGALGGALVGAKLGGKLGEYFTPKPAAQPPVLV